MTGESSSVSGPIVAATMSGVQTTLDKDASKKAPAPVPPKRHPKGLLQEAEEGVVKAEKEVEEEFTSVGKRVHNEITYRGVDFLLNSTIGVAFTYWTSRTQSGEKYWGKPVTGFFKKALSPVLKNPESLALGAKWGSMFTSIIVGGTAIIAPMIALENKKNKKAIITKVNHRVHGEDVVNSDPRYAQELENIDNEPKKSFGIGMAARLIVLAPMLWATFTPSINKQMIKYIYNPIAKGSKAAFEGLGIKPKYLLEKGVMEIADSDLSKPKRFVSDWEFLHQTIGFDFGLTFIYSFAHEAVIKGLASMGLNLTESKKDKDKKGPAEQPPPPEPLLVHAAPAITPQAEPAKKPMAHNTPSPRASVEEVVHQPETAITEMLA